MAAPNVAQFRFLSDLHLEFYDTHEDLLATIPWNPERDAQCFLLLAGDVGYPLGPSDAGQYRALLAALAGRFRGVFLIAGNHEYYQCQDMRATMAEVDVALDDMCRSLHHESRPVVFLQKGEWTFFVEQPPLPLPLPQQRYHVTQLLGCTLWSPVTADAARCVNDTSQTGVTPSWIRAIHTEHLGWLRKRLASTSAAARYSQLPPIAAVDNNTAAPLFQTQVMGDGGMLRRRIRQIHPQEEEEEEEEARTVDLPDDDNDGNTAAAAAAAATAMPRFTVIHLDGTLSSRMDATATTAVSPPRPDRRIVMTHHVPLALPRGASPQLWPKASAYFADVFRSFLWPEEAFPDIWHCGHLHCQARAWARPHCAVLTCCHGYRSGAGAGAGAGAGDAGDAVAAVDPHRPTMPMYSADLTAFMPPRPY